MTSPGIADFLLARIAEDEATARESGADAMVGWRWKHYPPEAYGEVQALTLAHSARVLAECDAKRRIVERVQLVIDSFERTVKGESGAAWPDVNRRERSHAWNTLHELALPYADHPDYNEAWRP